MNVSIIVAYLSNLKHRPDRVDFFAQTVRLEPLTLRARKPVCFQQNCCNQHIREVFLEKCKEADKFLQDLLQRIVLYQFWLC